MNIKIIFYFILFIIFLSSFLQGEDTETLTCLEQAEEAYVQHHFEEAALKSHQSLLSLSNQPTINQEQRTSVIKDFTKFSIAYAKLLANQSNFKKAREQIELILLPNANPNNPEALHLLKYLQAFNDSHQEKKISPLSQENSLEEIREITRANLLLGVEKDWTTTTPLPSRDHLAEQEVRFSNKETLYRKLHSIILPNIELEDVTIDEAIDYFKEKSRDADPEKEGVNIVLQPANINSETTEKNITMPPLASQKDNSHFNLELHAVPLAVALEYLAEQASCKVEIDSHAVSLSPLALTTKALSTREYEVPSSFFPNKESNTASIKNFLQSKGIEFPEGSCATYSPSLNRLVVRNTSENLDFIATLIKSITASPPLQVSIETKFIEVNQNDLSELGFNWLLGSFSLGGSGLDLSGGGSASGLNTAAYPFPTEGMNPIGALRSGNHAINSTSIDTVIDSNSHNAITESSVPGIFSIGGVCSTPQFQMVIRALNQKKGVDIMAAPHVTTKNGTKATIKIVDEFIYPSQYSPPQLPTSTFFTNNSSTVGLRHIPPTITPSFPNSWTSKNLGVTLEAKPTITPDHKMILLELHPQITDFDGFINYGTPINTVGYSLTATNISATPFSETLTTNTINQPVFTVREVNTSVMVKDGQTVIIGGLIREDIQHVEDKVPFLGDLFLVGRLFQSKSERKLKKNLIIFVTPKILNADGTTIKSSRF